MLMKEHFLGLRVIQMTTDTQGNEPDPLGATVLSTQYWLTSVRGLI
jgi:hypothetical protein